MHILAGIFVALTAVATAHADLIQFAYDFTAPTLNANQNITAFDLKADVLSSKAGQNNSPALPTLATKLVPNPFNPALKDSVPATTDGVDPKTLQNPQFFYVPNSFTVTKGADANTNDKFPGIPKGTTVRTDAVALSWEALHFPPTPVKFGAGNQLRFGATLDVDRAYYQPPNLGIGEKPAPKPAYRDTVKLKGGTWKLDDGSSVAAGQKAQHTMRMGMDAADPNGAAVIDGLSFAYTNDAANDVVLFDFGFETSMTQLALDALGQVGTALLNPVVTLDGLLQSMQSFYNIPAGSTLQFLFPATTDRYFIAHGMVFADGETQLGFAYETQVVLPVPAPWILIGAGAIALAGMRRARIMRTRAARPGATAGVADGRATTLTARA